MSSFVQFFKTRIAPTPSGYLHEGNLYSFLLTDAIARLHKASVLLRIDDMDNARKDDAYVKDIFDALRFMRVTWNEGPQKLEDLVWFSQQHRMPLYDKALQYLKDQKLLFACTCSRSEILRNTGGVYTGTCLKKDIPLDMPLVAWRLKTNQPMKLFVHDFRGEKVQTEFPEALNYFIVKRKENYPAYQLTSLVDDEHFGIDLIVRGQDLYRSTLAQLYMANLLNFSAFQKATFLHHGLLLNPDGHKMSKSADDTSIFALRKKGIARHQVIERISTKLSKPEQTFFQETLRNAGF